MKLTPRYVEICELLIRGLENREIGKLLFISEVTVKSHLSRIFRQNHCVNRVHLAVKYVEWKHAYKMSDLKTAVEVWTHYRNMHAPQVILNGVWTVLTSDPTVEVYQISGDKAIIRLSERGRLICHNNRGLIKFLQRDRDE